MKALKNFPPLIFILCQCLCLGRCSDSRFNSKHEVPALGRSARLGELYDAVTEQFVGVTVFNGPLPPGLITTSDNPWTRSHFGIARTLSERRKLLNIDANILIMMAGGLIRLTGHAGYLKETASNEKAIGAYIYYQSRTCKDTVDLYYNDVEPYILDPLKLAPILDGGIVNATHVLTSIDYGGDVVVEFVDQRREQNSTENITVSLTVALKVVGGLLAIEGEAGVNMTMGKSKKNDNLSIKIFGDVSDGNDSPQSFQEVIQFIKRVPELIRQYNDRKGKPVRYTLFPLNVLRERFRLNRTSSERVVYDVDAAMAEEFLRITNEMTRVTEKLKNLQEEINSNSNCLHRLHDIDNLFNPIIQNYDKATSRCQSKVKQGILAIREGLLGSEGFLQQWLHECQSNPSSPSNILLRIQKPDFVRLLQKLRICQVLKSGQTQDEQSFDLDNPLPSITGHYNPVEYLDTPAHLSSVLMKHMTRNVFVLFYSLEMKERDEERFTRSVAAFFRLRRSPLSQMVVVDCQNYPADCSLGVEKQLIVRVILVQYRRLKLISSDVATELSFSKPEMPIFEMKALGTMADIGQLYNANHRKGGKLLSDSVAAPGKEPLLMKLVERVFTLDFQSQLFYSDLLMKIRFEALNVPQHQALPILVGETSLQSYGKYINAGPPPWSWSHPRLLSGSFVFRYTSQTISVPVDDPRFHSLIDLSMIQGATHFVQEIQYGTMTIFQLRMDTDKVGDAQIATNNFNSALDDLKNYVIDLFNAKRGAEAKPQKTKNGTNPDSRPTAEEPNFPSFPRDLKFKIYSDTMESSPLETTSIQQVQEFLEGLASMRGVKDRNRERPLSFVLFPLVNLREYVGILQAVEPARYTLSPFEISLLWSLFEETEKSQEYLHEFARFIQFHTPSSVCLPDDSLRRLVFYSKIEKFVAKMKILYDSVPSFAVPIRNPVGEIMNDFYQMNLTTAHIDAQLRTQFPWIFEKFELYRMCKTNNILYRRGEDEFEESIFCMTNSLTSVTTYILFFDEQSVRRNREVWLENLYYFLNYLNTPGKNMLVILDCDCHSSDVSLCSTVGKMPVIQEFRNGVRSIEDIRTWLKTPEETSSGAEIRKEEDVVAKMTETQIVQFEFDAVSGICKDFSNLSKWLAKAMTNCSHAFEGLENLPFCTP